MMPLELILGGGATAVVGMLGYFLKKTHEKIDNTATAVTKLGENVERRVDQLEEKLAVETKATRVEIVQVFQDICHERQEACGALRDAKLEAVAATARAFCAKLHKVEEDRDRRWAKQDDLNERFKTHIYRTKNGGSSWELKDEK